MSFVTDLIDTFKGLWYGESKEEIEGYLIMNDSTNNKTMLLVKDGEKSWKTKWFNNNQMIHKVPIEPLQHIFANK
jgi:inorganic pyrophosphatase